MSDPSPVPPDAVSHGERVMPGWYDDPGSAGRWRLWDGRAWTSATRPAVPAPARASRDHSRPSLAYRVLHPLAPRRASLALAITALILAGLLPPMGLLLSVPALVLARPSAHPPPAAFPLAVCALVISLLLTLAVLAVLLLPA